MKVSILFITYNHSRFVREAIRSAMAQDYPDLELIVCDDGSSDGTREILDGELTSCPGHISVIEAHSTQNVGLIENFNRGIAASSGEVVVVMAGDDISMPYRVSRIAAEFAADPQCMLVYSNWIRIADAGEVLPGSCGHKEDRTFAHGIQPDCVYAGGKGAGSTAAYRAVVWRTFGPLDNCRRPEDRCYWVRALLLGKVRYLVEPLVKWRTHTTNISNYQSCGDTPETRKRILRDLLHRQNYGRQFRIDIEHAVRASLITPTLAKRLLFIICRERERERLRRFSLAEAPWKLWLGSALCLMNSSPSARNLFRISFADLPIRIFSRRREQKWAKRIRKGRG
jgi:glycosyltransferase involved in cell wall biosynthesis